MKRDWGKLLKPSIFFIAALAAMQLVVSCSDGGGNGVTTEPIEIYRSGFSETPIRITNAGDSTLAYTDYEQGAVVFINTVTLEEVSRFSVPGTPLGIAVVSNTVFVGIPERTEDGVKKGGNVNAFDMDGKYLYTLGSASGYGLTKIPTDIEVDETAGTAGVVFVLDASTKKVKPYDLSNPSLEPTSFSFWNLIPIAFGDAFFNPTGLALDTVNQLVYISDYGGTGGGAHGMGDQPPQIQSAPYQAFGWTPLVVNSVVPGYEFSTPQGLALDSSGNVYVPDVLGGRVLIFNSDGEGIGSIGSPGTDPGEFLSPLDIVLDEATGDIFVTNSRNRRVEVFRGAMR